MNLQIRLFVLREQEKNLRQKRDELERSLKRLLRTVDKADMLVTKLAVVLQFLQGYQSDRCAAGNLQTQQQLALRAILPRRGAQAHRRRP